LICDATELHIFDFAITEKTAGIFMAAETFVMGSQSQAQNK
jgi:hypothetical protein